jgi:hypothetical protein
MKAAVKTAQQDGSSSTFLRFGGDGAVVVAAVVAIVEICVCVNGSERKR